jgi:hypothetical protein
MCGLVVVPALPAAAEVMSYTYDFNSLTAGVINAQDNWYSDGLEVQDAPMGGAPHPGDGLCLTFPGGTYTYAGTRVNDGNWSFDLTGFNRFAIGAPWVCDYAPVLFGYQCEFRIVNSSTGKGIGYGIESFPVAFKAYIDDAAGNKNYQTSGPWSGYAKDQRIDFRLEVDTQANGGEGSGRLYYIRWYAGVTTWEQVPDLEDVNLRLLTAGADINNADQLFVKISCRLVAMDDLWVEVPEPVTLSLLALGACHCLLAIGRRRRRQGLVVIQRRFR